MITSLAGLNLIKEFEGRRLQAYLCPAGVWTIGYGHTTAAGAPAVSKGMSITPEEANDILKRDLKKYETAVSQAVKVPLSQNEFDALVSFCFNVGPGAFAKSSLVKKLNRRERDAVPAELMKWTKGGGRELPGLVRRRRAEAKLWRGLDSVETVNQDESRITPESPKPKKTITESREANAAAIAGATATVTAGLEAAPHIQTLSDALGRPVVLALLMIAGLCAAIWWFRRQRLEEDGV
jgi:lysozyme